MRNAPLLLALVMITLQAPRAHAQMFSDPLTVAGPRTQVAGVFSASEIEYEGDGSSDDIDRKILGVEMARGLSGAVDGFAQLGLIVDSEIGGFDDGQGFTFGIGGRSVVHKETAYRVSAYGAFTYQSEEFDEKSIKVELTTYDLHAGAVVGFNATPVMMPYAGLDLVLLSDGDSKVKIKGGGTYDNDDDDIERDDILNLKIGGLFNPATPTVRAEVVLMGEDTFTLAVGTFF